MARRRVGLLHLSLLLKDECDRNHLMSLPARIECSVFENIPKTSRSVMFRPQYKAGRRPGKA